MNLLILALSFFLSASKGKAEPYPAPKPEANSDPSIPTKNADVQDPLSALPAHSGGVFHPGLVSTISPHPHGFVSHAPHGPPHIGGHHGVFHGSYAPVHHDSKPKKVRKLNHVLTDGRGNIHIKTRRIFGGDDKKSENLYSDGKVLQAKIYQHDETDGIGNYHDPYTFNHGIHGIGHSFIPHHGGTYAPLHYGHGYPTGHHQIPIQVVPLDQGYNYQVHSPIYPVIGVDHGIGHGFGHSIGHGLGHSTGHGGLGISHGVGHGVSHGISPGIDYLGSGYGHNIGYIDHGISHGHGLGHGVGHGVGHVGLRPDHGGHGPILISHVPTHGISHVPAYSISPDVGHVIGAGGAGRVGRGIRGLATDSHPPTILIGATPLQHVQYI